MQSHPLQPSAAPTQVTAPLPDRSQPLLGSSNVWLILQAPEPSGCFSAALRCW